MALCNTSSSYGSVAKFFHWLIALLVITMLIFGYFLGDIPEEYQGMAYNLHKLTGLTILLLMILRGLWALMNVKPALPFDMPQWQRSAARIVHFLLYFTLIAMPTVGWLGAILAARPPHLGDWQITLPLNKNLALSGFMFDIHNMLAVTIIVLLCLHVLGGFYHYFIRRDKVVQRMLPGSGRF